MRHFDEILELREGNKLIEKLGGCDVKEICDAVTKIIKERPKEKGDVIFDEELTSTILSLATKLKERNKGLKVNQLQRDLRAFKELITALITSRLIFLMR